MYFCSKYLNEQYGIIGRKNYVAEKKAPNDKARFG